VSSRSKNLGVTHEEGNSLDHLVGSGEQVCRHFYTKCFGGFRLTTRSKERSVSPRPPIWAARAAGSPPTRVARQALPQTRALGSALNTEWTVLLAGIQLRAPIL